MKPLFTKRIRSRADFKARLPFIPSSTEKLQTYLQAYEDLNDRRVLYIHIPFCTKTCDFCGYTRTIKQDELVAMYVANIKSQIKETGQYPWVGLEPFSAVFFGGGSPGCIHTGHIATLLDACRTHLHITCDCEITIELTLDDVDKAQLDSYKRMGINRISFGVQSFSTELRRSLGRSSSTTQVTESIKLAHTCGFTNIYVDLIYNIPLQNRKDWHHDLSLLQELPINGCSIYPLINFPNSLMAKQGSYKDPIHADEYAVYSSADDFLQKTMQWECYTPVQYGDKVGSSNYINLLAYQADMLAFGNGAGGKIGKFQYLVSTDIKSLTANPGISFFDSIKVFEFPDQFLEHKKILRLPEKGKVFKEDIQSGFNFFKNELNSLISNKLVVATEDTFELTQQGRFWAGNISDNFVASLTNVIINS